MSIPQNLLAPRSALIFPRLRRGIDLAMTTCPRLPQPPRWPYPGSGI